MVKNEKIEWGFIGVIFFGGFAIFTLILFLLASLKDDINSMVFLGIITIINYMTAGYIGGR